MAEKPFQLADVRFVKRITIGSHDATLLKTHEEIERATELLNRCLTEYPRGTILGIEKSFQLLHIGEHQVVMQYHVYHVGFARKPQWLEGG
ncbi:MAG: hypothetical protein M3N05_00260 [Pseudomonadota bacterium]|nr:hypothetical protein [Pseudomonadota bacterium]